MCSRWTGVLSAAIIADGGGCISRHVRRQVSALHARVESGGRCRLDISLCEDAPGMAAGDGLYPVNSLRNVALRAARTDLVLSLVSGERSVTICKTFLFCALWSCGAKSCPRTHCCWFDANFRPLRSPDTILAMQNDTFIKQQSSSTIRLRTSTVCQWRVCTRLFPLLRRTNDYSNCAEEETLLVDPMLGVSRRRQQARRRRLWLFQR